MNRLLIFTFCLLFLLQSALADAGWVLMTADMKQQPVALQAIASDGVRVVPLGGGGGITVPFDEFLQIDRTAQPRAAGASLTLTLILTNGDRLTGQPLNTKDEQITWRCPALGQTTVALKDVRALVRYGSTIDNLDQPPTEDTILLNNGDTAKGIITDLSESKLIIQAAAPVEIPLDSVRWIHFAKAPESNPALVRPLAPDRVFRARLNDDSLIRASSIVADEQKITLTLADRSTRDIPLGAVAAIEQLNGPLSWLSSRTPVATVQLPYFGGKAWPTRMDSTVGGKPIQFADRTYARGIGIHAYSRIDYPLDGSYAVFRTQYAIAQDDKRQYADVTVRIKLDGKTVHERASLRADELAPPVLIDIPKNARRLTLEVDYGQANDTQDRFNWIEPALLRQKPPPTQPATPTR